MPVKRKYFWSYLSAMAELKISRRTLQRWIDDTDIEPLTFEDNMRAFLTLKHIECLEEYSRVMKTRDMALINRYRAATRAEDTAQIIKLRKSI